MSFDERVDVVDLILKVLKEHEKNLDTIVSQLGETIQTQPTQWGRDGQVLQVKGISEYRVSLHRWSEFSAICEKPDLVAFDLKKGELKVSAIKGGNIFSYVEEIPEMTIRVEEDGEGVIVEGGNGKGSQYASSIFSGKLQCGLGVRARRCKPDSSDSPVSRICYDVDPEEVRAWLSTELRTEKKHIAYGSIDR